MNSRIILGCRYSKNNNQEDKIHNDDNFIYISDLDNCMNDDEGYKKLREESEFFEDICDKYKEEGIQKNCKPKIKKCELVEV